MLEQEKINGALNEVNNNADYLEKIAVDVEKSCVGDLITFMEEKTEMVDKDEISTKDLTKSILQLSHMLFLVGHRLEEVGIRESIAKLIKTENYNKAYINNDVVTIDENGKKVKPTVATNQAMAENQTTYENIILNLHSSIYKSVKGTIDAAYEFLSSMKKILSYRMVEMELSKIKEDNSVIDSTIDTEF